MNIWKKTVACMVALLTVAPAMADEGMWILKELNKQNLLRMQELGFTPSYEELYSEKNPSVTNAVVIFGGGCTGITVSKTGLVFTNHHCGFGAIQQLSSVEHDYLKDGFVSQSQEEELPVPGLSVRYLRETKDVSERILSEIKNIENEADRLAAADSIGQVLCDELGKNPLVSAEVVPFYNNNKYYLVVYDVFSDVRMVFAPPSSLGKFGGDTDNWMWPRQTCDFSVFRVYANAENKAAKYDKANKPYVPKYAAKVSMQGYHNDDYAMTIGFPGSTDRFLSSWGVKQRIEDSNNPRIEVRGVKQDLWKEAMMASDKVRIQYASKYASSSNYWKNAIGMNKGLENLNIISRKQAEEAAFRTWTNADAKRKATYGKTLELLENGYTESGAYTRNMTYLYESFMGGAEILRLARSVSSINVKDATEEKMKETYDAVVLPFFKNYNAALDQKVFAALMKVVKEKVDKKYLPSIYAQIDKKYKGDYERYASDVFKKTVVLNESKVRALLLNEKKFKKAMAKDPAVQFANAVSQTLSAISAKANKATMMIHKGRREYVAGILEMNPHKAYTSDANFTMRMSYGSIGDYRPYDGAWYDYYTTDKGILEKENPNDDEFWVQPELLDLIRTKDFGQYGNANGTMNLCFLSNNDITGGNSGSPVFNKNAHLIGLAFDGNWEAMSGDIAFEPELQRTISVDIRFVLYMIDKWGKCPRLIKELELVKD